MSGVRRFLSRRDKSPAPLKAQTAQRNNARARRLEHFGGVFVLPGDSSSKPDKDEEKSIKNILDRFRHYGIEHLEESNVLYALRSCTPKGDPQAAFQFLMLLEDTYEGIVKPYNPDMKLKGAVNRQGVSCYLDALLFAMFVKLDSFEAMLYDNFEDPKRKRLAGLLRLWVNILRSGKLITTDLTEQLQKAMASLGWLEATKLIQQDPSEAFTFITDHLELPMLTLKMDMFHTGKEDLQDDHKFVNERLLEVAILDEPPEGRAVVTLEDCLEHYFNNRIEIKRHLENQRRNTIKSVNSSHPSARVEKDGNMHIEIVDLGESTDTPTASTPIVGTPMAESPVQMKMPTDKLRPISTRKRTDSIFSQRRVELGNNDAAPSSSGDANGGPDLKLRKMSTTKTEVLMPAWQFFKLLPWYTDHMPTSDAQVAAHFSKKRPVLGICLKRYSYTYSGQAKKLETFVDIPLDIAVPNFVGDDSLDDHGPLFGNFRLVLQSVVCHRGVSVNSGHYVSLCRGELPANHPNRESSDNLGSDMLDEAEDPWMRFDDLASERITPVNIQEALKQEMPYLLFYQVLPIDEVEHATHDLPSYAEAISRSASTTALLNEKATPRTETPLTNNNVDSLAAQRLSSEGTDISPNSARTSIDAPPAFELHHCQTHPNVHDHRRLSIPFDSTSIGGSISTTRSLASSSVPTTPSEEKSVAAAAGASLFNVANKLTGSRRGSRSSKGRPPSSGPDNSISANRFALSMTKLTQRVSRTDSSNTDPDNSAAAVVDTLAADKAGESGKVIITAASPTPSPVPPGNRSKDLFPKGHTPGEAPADTAATTHQPIPAAHVATGSRPSRKDKAHARLDRRRSDKTHEDRDCVVM